MILECVVSTLIETTCSRNMNYVPAMIGRFLKKYIPRS